MLKHRALAANCARGDTPLLLPLLSAPVRSAPHTDLRSATRGNGIIPMTCAMCGLTETDRTPDFTTIQDFAQLMGEDGVRLINEGVVEQAVKLGLADAKVVVADLTSPSSIRSSAAK